MISAFARAFENGDVPAVVGLLTDDAWLTMPPVPLEYQGHAAIAPFLTEFGFHHGQRSYRLIPVRANGQPAFGRYARDPQASLLHATGLTVLSLDGEKIAQITAFLGHDPLARFGLPRTLPG